MPLVVDDEEDDEDAPSCHSVVAMRVGGEEVTPSSHRSIAIGWHVGWPRRSELCVAAASFGSERP